MANLFYMGGTLFMGILTALLVMIIAAGIYFFLTILTGKSAGKSNFQHRLTYIRSLGLFTMITGILGQLIGLFSAFKAIEAAMDISPALLAGGLKVSMITTLYGIFIYLFSILVWFLLDIWYHSRTKI
jgi:hypothetical protein